MFPQEAIIVSAMAWAVDRATLCAQETPRSMPGYRALASFRGSDAKTVIRAPGYKAGR